MYEPSDDRFEPISVIGFRFRTDARGLAQPEVVGQAVELVELSP